MIEPKKLQINTPDNEYLVVPCPSCDKETRNKVLADVFEHMQYADALIDVWTNYKIVQCQGCLRVTFFEVSQCSEDIIYPKNGKPFYPETKTYYPNRIAGRPLLRNINYLPRGVNLIYKEAHNALCAQLPILTGLGIRAIVEAICKDKNMVGRNLQEKIDSLAKQGLVAIEGAKILHNLRYMGMLLHMKLNHIPRKNYVQHSMSLSTFYRVFTLYQNNLKTYQKWTIN
ncbi:DUF4145 domain-containing protein [candidate division KSB1 bacterium]|nr:DUF4145 domain-containing protein [candidate division KSB1 bacterium]